MTPPSTMKEHSWPIEIDTHTDIKALTFSANGEYHLSGDKSEIRVWRVEDGKQIANMETGGCKDIYCLAVSKDGRWIAAGTWTGAILWDAKTYKQVFALGRSTIQWVDFSPDSTRVCGSYGKTATVWDVATRKQVLSLHHERTIVAVKYSLHGGRIATAISNSVRVWDSNNGRLLVDIQVTVIPDCNTGLLWFNNHLFVVSDRKIKEFEASSGATVSDWPVTNTSGSSCIALSHGEFIAYSTKRTVTFWDTLTHTQLGLIQYPSDIIYIAFSPDDQFLAIGGRDGKITTKNLKDVLLPSYSSLPFIQISNAAFDSWKRDQLADTEASLTETITKSRHKNHLTFAIRALTRVQLRHSDLAIEDSGKSIKICSSVIGYISKSIALIGVGKEAECCRVYDLVFRHCHPNEVDFLLLIKAVVLFMAGEHVDAVSRVDDLIATVHFTSICYVVQAYMYLHLGNSCMEKSDYAGAIRFFECARPQMRYYLVHRLLIITFISGWKFDDLDVMIRQRLCEALYAAGHSKDAAESLLKLVNTIGEDVDSSQPILTDWVSDFTHRYLSASKSDATQQVNPSVLQDPFNSSTSTAVLREWAKATLASRSWKDALVAAVGVSISFRSSSYILREFDALGLKFIAPRFTIYRAVCERLEAIDRITDATECFHQIVSELDTRGEQAKWALEFRLRCAEKLDHLGDDVQQHDEAISRYSAALFLNPNPSRFVKRSEIYVAMGLWEEALADTSQVKALDSSSLWGYEKVLREWAKVKLTDGSWRDALSTIGIFEVPRFTIYRALCERLETLDRILDATECFHELCVPASEGDATQHAVLRGWATATLAICSWKDVLDAAVGFISPRFTTYRAICNHLEAIDYISDATECFHEMASVLAQESDSEQVKWIINFKSRNGRKLEDLGDLAMSAGQHDAAISQYAVALSLNPTNPALFVKRSKARAYMSLWQDALNDANEVITLDPSSPLGYERKHEALRGAGCYGDAIVAFDTMLSKISQSSDPQIRERFLWYVNPTQTEATIREAIKNAIHESPSMLINTNSGRLLDKSGQMSSFESQPIFHDLVSSMTTEIDHARINHEVAQYYRYAMFSHKWEDNEPLFEKVIRIVVYDLDESLTHDKLKMFCKIVRDAGLHWAWSDTCCINKGDSTVLQEALVSMFQWYQGSTMTLILLRDVSSPARHGDIVRSIWNTRAWTFQEYHASKVVRFYNKDWTLYRNIDIPNHKESPEIVSEMEEATGVSARALMALRPGLEDIQEKLRLASTRQTTRVEDAAYSLLGIFSLSLPVVYGEGDTALGRLLAQLLMSSGDTSILAWTGQSGSFNSCLPAKIAVFNQLQTSHVPCAMNSTEMETIIAGLRASSVNLTLVTKLYDRLDELRVPLFTGKRMALPCIFFKLGPLSISRSRSERVFRAQTAALGIVEIKTGEDLSRLDSLYLVHPWIDFLLDHQPVGSVIHNIAEENTNDQSSLIGNSPSFSRPPSITSVAPQTRTARLASRFEPTLDGDTESLRPPSTLAETDKQTRALQVIARLRQPFGALLLTPNPGNVAAYRRVASESLITVQVEEITRTIFKLNKLIANVRVLDVL
ncbi:hypothetical protein OG21DRAFT_1498291 [Imleria badia]|nr:hypothetical protein OG21DRAFT_1498291 [Imleria badia]